MFSFQSSYVRNSRPTRRKNALIRHAATSAATAFAHEGCCCISSTMHAGAGSGPMCQAPKARRRRAAATRCPPSNETPRNLPQEAQTRETHLHFVQSRPCPGNRISAVSAGTLTALVGHPIQARNTVLIHARGTVVCILFVDEVLNACFTKVLVQITRSFDLDTASSTARHLLVLPTRGLDPGRQSCATMAGTAVSAPQD